MKKFDTITFDQRKIIKCRVDVGNIETKKLLYRRAADELAKWLISNNAICVKSDAPLYPANQTELHFYIQTYLKPIDWESL